MNAFDSRPSSSRWRVKEEGPDLRFYLEVRGLGVVSILTSSDRNEDRGRLKPESCQLITFPVEEDSPLL